jgi:hypothetical protein
MEQVPLSSKWPPPWPPPSDHGAYTEARFKDIETDLLIQDMRLDTHEERLTRADDRLTLHDKALQAIALVLWFGLIGSAHSKASDIADILLSLIKGLK